MNCLKCCEMRRSFWFLSARAFSSGSVCYAAQKAKILIVGGGTGGCSIGAKLTNKLGPGKVTIVEASDRHYYQPYFTLIGGGMKKFKDSYKPMKSVLPAHAKWVKDKVETFNPKSNSVTTKTGDTIEYEYMIVAAGLELNYDSIPGLTEALSIPNGKVCSIYSPKYVNRTFEAMKNVKKGNAIFTLPNTAVKCAGAPQKICYITDEYLRKNGRRNGVNIIYNTSLPVLFSSKHYADALWKLVEKRSIMANLRTNLVEVLPRKSQAVFENLDTNERTSIEFEMLHVTPPMSAPKELKFNSGDLVNADGFVDVDKGTLQHVKYPNVFGLGDCSSAPTSKTAAACAAQSQIVFQNLVRILNQGQPNVIYDGYTSCPLVTGYRKCILAEFDYTLEPRESFPIDQSKERYTMFAMKRFFMSPLYWHLMLNGYWNGPAFIRKMWAK